MIRRKPCPRCNGEGSIRIPKDRRAHLELKELIQRLQVHGVHAEVEVYEKECWVCLGTGLDSSAEALEGET